MLFILLTVKPLDQQNNTVNGPRGGPYFFGGTNSRTTKLKF